MFGFVHCECSHRFLTLIAELDRCKGWSDGATASCAHWLNWKCGIDMGAAREKVRPARALEDPPKISDAMARGELSYAQVCALTRVAFPGTEAYFLKPRISLFMRGLLSRVVLKSQHPASLHQHHRVMSACFLSAASLKS